MRGWDQLRDACTEEHRARGVMTKFSGGLGYANIANLFSEAKDF